MDSLSPSNNATNRVNDHRGSDVIILILGVTGAGKSTFINVTAGEDVASVSHGLNSCTTEVQTVVVPYRNSDDISHRIVFVDTPGFNDTSLDDSEISRRISIWLAHSYNQGKKVAGIIYLHDISEGRFEISKNALNVMKQYFCDGAAGKVVLATTKWDDVKPEVAERREKQLSRKYWKEMLDKGSQMARFLHTPKSAWEIVDLIIQPNPLGTVPPNPLPNPFSPLSAFTTVGFVTAVVSFPMIYYVFGS